MSPGPHAVEPIVDYDAPPEVGPERGGWHATAGVQSLLPAALFGAGLMLAWRVLGVRMFREGVEPDWRHIVIGAVLPVLLTTLYPVWAIRRGGGRVFGRWPGWQRVLIEAAVAFGVLVCVFGVNLLIGAVWSAYSKEPIGLPPKMEELIFGGNPVVLLLFGLLACVWAPIGEELFFRRLLLRAFSERMRLVVAVIVQALIFAVMHDYAGVHLVVILVLGLALGGVYAWRRTILTPMFLHLFQNTATTLLIGGMMVLSRFAPVLGVSGDTVEQGARVVHVEAGSAAEAAGLRPGDILTEVDGVRIREFASLRLLLLFKRPGDSVTLGVLRDGEKLTLEAVLRKRPRENARGMPARVVEESPSDAVPTGTE